MANANGSLTGNIGNRRVRGTKPPAELGESSGVIGDLVAAGRARREAAIAARRAQGDTSSSNAAPTGDGKRRRGDTAPKTRTEKVADVAALLRNGLDGDDDGGDADDDANDAGDQAPNGEAPETDDAAPITLEALAESLEVDVADLWAVEFNDSTGKKQTLGALKDLLQKGQDFDARELAFAVSKSSQENELMRARQALDYILASLPKNVITPELKTRAAAERDRVLKLEAERVAEAIPDWKNATTAKAERAKIGEWMKQWGYGEGDLERMYDHRMLKLLRDYWQLDVRVKDALAKVQPDKNGRAGPPARSGNSARRERAPQLGPNATRNQKVAAVAHLLRNGL